MTKDGTFLSTCFTFDKQSFPMMQSFQNALYINTIDPSMLSFLIATEILKIVKINPPGIRGFRSRLEL